MEILTEQAASYDECIAKINAKYGPNVHILRQKRVKTGGLLGFFEKDAIELNFMITRDPLRASPSSYTAPAQGRESSFEEEKRRILTQAARTSPEIAQRIAPHIEAASQAAQAAQAAQLSQAARKGIPQRDERLDTILEAVKNLERKIERPSEAETVSAEHETVLKIERLLEQNDFSASYTRSVIARMRSEFSLEELSDYDRVQDTVVEWIGESILLHEGGHSARPRVIALVGPTGVGKTTTVAKLAAAYSLAASKGSRPLNVHVITIDNYRIGAKQQIEIYGNIMNIPVSCAETAKDLESLIALHQDVDIILIDTIGKSPKDYSRIAEMRHFLEAAGQISDVHLAMSATTKPSDMREIMQQYETFGYSSVIITKFDETSRIGNIVSVLGEKKKALAYITTGQRVPQDFERASVVRFLINLEGFRVNRSRIESLFPAGEERFEWR